MKTFNTWIALREALDLQMLSNGGLSEEEMKRLLGPDEKKGERFQNNPIYRQNFVACLDWVSAHKPADTDPYISEDGKSILLSYGDGVGEDEEPLAEKLRSKLSPGSHLEILESESGKPAGYDYVLPRFGYRNL
jgi:hypothetical protein